MAHLFGMQGEGQGQLPGGMGMPFGMQAEGQGQGQPPGGMGMPPPSDDELAQMINQYKMMVENGTIDPNEAPPELNELLKQVDAHKRGGPSPADQQAKGEDIKPQAGFVVKTQNDEGRKIFLNMCGSDKLPAPGNWQTGKVPEEVVNALQELNEDAEGSPNDALRFPLSMAEPKNDFDKKGEPCTVFDVVFNLDVIKQAIAYRRLKVFIVELAIAWVGQKHNMVLDPKYKLPHLKYKGDGGPSEQRIRVDPKALITEMGDLEEEEPTFGLRATPIPATAPLPPGGLEAAAAAVSASMPSSSSSAGGGANASLPPPSRASAATPLPDNEPTTTAAASSSFSFAKSTQSSAVTEAPSSTSKGITVPKGELLPELQYRLEFLNRPVTHAVAHVEIPRNTKVENVLVAVAREALEVEVAGRAPLRIPLPFAVSSTGADAALEVKGGVAGGLFIRVTVPYRPYLEVVDAARISAPHAYGSLKLSSLDSFMELEP
ncbi:hypothetical protein CYMTET_16565 [Cymbomonas tetramitiformis]|uniref:PIH1 N-terminal domain-containing protein n=1 Tax=Cymbomonas tetramitiformis TaxID=36881 RepID=A0AAE0L7T3_9CHLO|nr:hypothetical protein CYMTET_16565 [Cymbomonas tetramitiformis]